MDSLVSNVLRQRMGAEGAEGKGDAKFILDIECDVWDPSAGIYSDGSKMLGAWAKAAAELRLRVSWRALWHERARARINWSGMLSSHVSDKYTRLGKSLSESDQLSLPGQLGDVGEPGSDEDVPPRTAGQSRSSWGQRRCLRRSSWLYFGKHKQTGPIRTKSDTRRNLAGTGKGSFDETTILNSSKVFKSCESKYFNLLLRER